MSPTIYDHPFQQTLPRTFKHQKEENPPVDHEGTTKGIADSFCGDQAAEIALPRLVSLSRNPR